MAEFEYWSDVQRWLRDRPRGDEIVLAARAALRSAPIGGAEIEPTGPRQLLGTECALVSILFWRELALCWLAAIGTNRRIDLQNAASSASYHTDDYTRSPLESHTYFARMTIAGAAKGLADEFKFPGQSLTRPYKIMGTVYGPQSVTDALLADAQLLEESLASSDLLALPLWPEGEPSWFTEDWAALKDYLLAAHEGWDVWTQWYEQRLHGNPFDRALEEARALIEDEVWEQGPKAVNAEIKRLIEEHRAKAPPVPDLPEERLTPIRFEFRDGALHRAPSKPPHPPEQRRAAAERGWQANRDLLDDFIDSGGGGQNPRLAAVLARCRDALGQTFEALDVILLGVHHARLQGFAERADEVLLPEDAADLVALNAQLGVFLGQFPEWTDYVSGISDGFGTPEAEQQAVEDAKGALGEIEHHAPGLIAPDAKEGLDMLAEAASPDPTPDEPEPVAPPVERRSFLRGVRSFVRALAEEALSGVQRGVGTSAHALTVAAFAAAGAHFSGLAQLLPGEFGWLSSIVTYLARMIGL